MMDCSAAPIACGERVTDIDLDRRIVETANGLRLRYRELVSSLPLPSLIGMCRGASAEVRASAAALESAAVTMIQVGMRERRPTLDAHWTYFPEARIPFYRLTRLERISPDLCPPGTSALLLECPGRSAPDPERVLAALVELDVISTPAVEWYGSLCIPDAYVLFRPGTTHAVAMLLEALHGLGVRSIGRYGEWRYANIEQCVVSGLDAAHLLAPQGSAAGLLH
jgi:protoporphyrinogen oxidase